MFKIILFILIMISIPYSTFADIPLPVKKSAKVLDIVSNKVIKTDIGNVKLANLQIKNDIKSELSNLLLNKEVIIWSNSDESYDRYNNLTAHVTIDNLWIQEYLIKNKLAYAMPNNIFPNIIDKLYDAETISSTQDINDIEITNDFEIIEGQIISAKLQKKYFYLNFDKDWKSDFTISIKKSDLKNFPKEYQREEFWLNKKVRVRGYLEEYYGPIIKVKYPKQIQILD